MRNKPENTVVRSRPPMRRPCSSPNIHKETTKKPCPPFFWDLKTGQFLRRHSHDLPKVCSSGRCGLCFGEVFVSPQAAPELPNMAEQPVPADQERPATVEVERRFMERYCCCRLPPIRVLAKPSFQHQFTGACTTSRRAAWDCCSRALLKKAPCWPSNCKPSTPGFPEFFRDVCSTPRKSPRESGWSASPCRASLTDDEFFALL